MLGLVFTELLEMVESKHSFDLADEVLTRAGASGAYTSVGDYPDAELGAIVRALSEVTGTPAGDLLHAFGVHLFGRFQAGFPMFFVDHRDAFAFLEGLESRVHVEVRKLYSSARTPSFVLHPEADGARVLEYRSERGLWRFALGLLEATLAHFGHTAGPVVVEDVSEGAGTHVRFHVPV
jgi:hypothetical protein